MKELNISEAVPISKKKEKSGYYYFIVPDGTVYASSVPVSELKKQKGLGIIPVIIGAAATLGSGAFNFFKSQNDKKTAQEYAASQNYQAQLKAQQTQTILLVGGGLGAALLLVLALK